MIAFIVIALVVLLAVGNLSMARQTPQQERREHLRLTAKKLGFSVDNGVYTVVGDFKLPKAEHDVSVLNLGDIALYLSAVYTQANAVGAALDTRALCKNDIDIEAMLTALKATLLDFGHRLNQT